MVSFIKDHLALIAFHTLLIIAILSYPPFSIFLALFGLAVQTIVEAIKKDKDSHIVIVAKKI